MTSNSSMTLRAGLLELSLNLTSVIPDAMAEFIAKHAGAMPPLDKPRSLGFLNGYERRNHSGADLLDGEWRAADAAVNELADRAIELNGDGVSATADHRGRQAVDVARANVVTDSNPISDAETSQCVGETGSLDGLDAVADGVVEEMELAVELAGGDESDQGLDRVGGQPRVVVGCGASRA
jgi:hypothetical protein